MKRARKIFAIIVVAYLVIGPGLWISGGYVLTQSGQTRYAFGIPTGISVHDIIAWKPLFGHFQAEYEWPGGATKPRCSFLGTLFFPLFYFLDQSKEKYWIVNRKGFPIENSKIPMDIREHPFFRIKPETGTE